MGSQSSVECTSVLLTICRLATSPFAFNACALHTIDLVYPVHKRVNWCVCRYFYVPRCWVSMMQKRHFLYPPRTLHLPATNLSSCPVPPPLPHLVSAHGLALLFPPFPPCLVPGRHPLDPSPVLCSQPLLSSSSSCLQLWRVKGVHPWRGSWGAWSSFTSLCSKPPTSRSNHL